MKQCQCDMWKQYSIGN